MLIDTEIEKDTGFMLFTKLLWFTKLSNGNIL